MENKSNKRCVNFTPEEEALLVSLVDKYKEVVESKKTGSTTWTDKENAWKRIEEEFNSLSGRNSFRTVKNLKEKYYNLKKKTKQKFSTNKLNSIKTGGGPYTPILISDVDNAIKNIIGSQIDGLSNKYDSDSVMPTTSATTLGEIASTSVDISLQSGYTEDIILEVIDDDKDENLPNNQQDCTEIKDWSTYSGKMLREPVSSKLKANKSKKPDLTRSKRVVTEKINSTKKYVNLNHLLIQEKLDFVRYQKDKFEEEHALKVELLKKKIKLIEYKLSEK